MRTKKKNPMRTKRATPAPDIWLKVVSNIILGFSAGFQANVSLEITDNTVMADKRRRAPRVRRRAMFADAVGGVKWDAGSSVV